MLRHDPFAPIVRAEMADRWRRAERQRLLREARAHQVSPAEPARDPARSTAHVVPNALGHTPQAPLPLERAAG